MSKDELTFEQAVEKRDQIKSDLKTARKEVAGFRKENNIKKEETPKDKKLAAKLADLESAVTTLEEKLEKAAAKARELKPATNRQTKYTYPLIKDKDSGKEREMTGPEKKKFRAKARAEKRKAENPEPEKKEKTKKAPEAEVDKKKKKVQKEKQDED